LEKGGLLKRSKKNLKRRTHLAAKRGVWDLQEKKKRELQHIDESAEKLQEDTSQEQPASEKSAPTPERTQVSRLVKHRDSLQVHPPPSSENQSNVHVPQSSGFGKRQANSKSRIVNHRNSLLTAPLRRNNDNPVRINNVKRSSQTTPVAVITLGSSSRQVAAATTDEHLDLLSHEAGMATSHRGSIQSSRRGSAKTSHENHKDVSASPSQGGPSRRHVAFATRRMSDERRNENRRASDETGSEHPLLTTCHETSFQSSVSRVPSKAALDSQCEPDKPILGYSEEDLDSTQSMEDLSKLLEQRLERIADGRSEQQHLPLVPQAAPHEALMLSPHRPLNSQISEIESVTLVTSPPMDSPSVTMNNRPGSAGQPGFLRARRALNTSARGCRTVERPKTPDASSPSLRAWRNANIGACSLAGHKGMDQMELLGLKLEEERSCTSEAASTGISSPPVRCRLMEFAPALALSPPKVAVSKDRRDTSSRREKPTELQGLGRAVRTLAPDFPA